MFEAAALRVQLRVEPQTWSAFQLTAIDGLSAAEAAARLSMGVATVFKAKSRVQAMLRDEIRRLDSDETGGSEASAG
jgi:RNA polymerase sigma-70 factor (ECF subfamily)